MVHAAIRRDLPVSLPAMLRESWSRCSRNGGLASRSAGLTDRLCAAELRQARVTMGVALHAASVELDHLACLVLPLGYVALLSDPHGVVVAHRGSEAGEARTRRWNLRSGAIWTEASAGTNGLGTCLVEGKAVTISGGEHWCHALHHLTCTAMPFFDAEGQIAGALNVSVFANDPKDSGIMEALLLNAARAIECRLFQNRFGMGRVLLLEGGEGPSQPLVALDETGRIIGASRSARDRALPSVQTPEGAQFWPGPLIGDEPSRPDFRKAELRTIEDALSLTQGKIAPAARILGISRSTLHRKIKTLGIENG
ncbi:helix-turn-helix domain-containing protein [Asaia sp. HN010]|uniref:helix-turn-helix domain-containing protein n=1 Tax=Asaia sp. HN010 TaxID=3081233 RepID=UPI003018D322